jgi:hypothetical protein
MQSFIQYLTEQSSGHFVALRPTAESCDWIYEIITTLDIKTPVSKKELHCTMMHTRKDLNMLYSPSKKVYEAIAKSIGFLNGYIVLFLNSVDLQLRFNELKLLCGGVSSYPDFIPHITLSYQKNLVLSNDKINNFKPFYLNLENEYCSQLKD